MRLKRKKIFCISPTTINTCGAINLVCFDKTGTLTEDGLDFHCALPSASTADGAVDGSFGSVELAQLTIDNAVGSSTAELIQAVASCHSLTKIGGKLCGDPLDMILFSETKWTLDEPQIVEETNRYARYYLITFEFNCLNQ